MIQLPGEIINPESLKLEKAIDFKRAVETSDFSYVVKVLRQEDGAEIIVFQTEVEIGQYPKYDIRRAEILAVSFTVDDNFIPKVFTLREDFPELPHQYMEVDEFPKSLCLYELSYDDLKVFWTGFIFLERIREWFKLSVSGQLHQDDQPLEPLMANFAGTLVFPNDYKEGEDFYLYLVSEDYHKRINILATRRKLVADAFNATLDILEGIPQVHGIIKKTPKNLLELADFLLNAGIDLRTHLKEKLISWYQGKKQLSSKLILLISLPKSRSVDGGQIQYEYVAFITHQSLEEIGSKLQLWERVNGYFAPFVNIIANFDALSDCWVDVLMPMLSYGRTAAMLFNDIHIEKQPSVVCVGMGALGSQVFMNLIRSGFGIWTIIDPDILYPHNLARHTLFLEDVLYPKVNQMAHRACLLLGEPDAVKPLMLNVISDKRNEQLKKAMLDADVILDMSASSTALKTLGEINSHARIFSSFVNPKGTDLIFLAEDSQKMFHIQDLEVQYLRVLIYHEIGLDHFVVPKGRFRYATGCREISSRMPHDSLAFFSAICSKVIKQFFVKESACINIWRINEDTLENKLYEFPPYKTYKQKIDKWEITYDDFILDKIFTARSQKIPNETGGILIGRYDMSRCSIYVADLILSPKDSVEYPTAYIRGIEGIESQLDSIKNVTGGALQYLGEWHSHPEGYNSNPSEDDLILLKWLFENMYKEGLPALMLIAGSNKDYSFYLAEQYERFSR